MNFFSANQGEIDIKKYKKLKRISKGGFGTVYKVEEKETGELFAAKIIDCDDDEEMCNQMIKREISIMMYAQHPTIIKFIGYSKEDFHEENNITIIMELAKNGSLKNVLKKIQEGDGPKDFTNTSRQIILVGIARGMKYLHDRSIIHRDLKTDNILLDDDFHPHITDFGLSKFIEAGHTRSQTKFGGTLPYEAPEILQGEKYDQKVDVYSFGIMMFEILTDSVPYPELENLEKIGVKFINKIIDKNYRPKFKVPVKKSFKNLIEKCWSKNPDERPTFGEIFTMLSNKNTEEEDGEDFMLDDVDVDELNLYIEDITEITDSTEKLVSKMNQMEAEIKKLKSENKKLKKEIKQTNVKQLKKEIDQLKSKVKRQQDTIDGIKKDKMKLENEIEKLKKENQNYKNIIDKHKEEDKNQPEKETSVLKSKMKYTKSIIVGGVDRNNQLGEKPNNKNKYGDKIIHPPVKLSFDPSLLSYSAYSDHSVLVMSDGSLKGIGSNKDGRISSTLQKTEINDFTDFCIKDSNGHQLAAVSAVCYHSGTLYMFSKDSGNERQLVLCDKDINEGDPVFLDIGNHHPVSLFGGCDHSAAIGSEGEVIFIDHKSIKNSPNSPIPSFSLPDGEKASSVACCKDSVVVLSSNGYVFTSKIELNGVLNFSIVPELSDQEIVCVSGTNEHCLAVSKDGHVFGRGSNEYGQLGLGKETESVSLFTQIPSLSGYEIRAAYAGCSHSLFETREGKIISCGSNSFGQLFLSSGPGKYVYSPTETTITSGASFCIAGDSKNIVFIGSGPLPNTPNTRIDKFE